MFAAALLVLAAQPPAPKDAPVDPLRAIPAFAREAVKPNPTDTPLRKLQKERARLRAELAEAAAERLAVGRGDVAETVRAKTALAESLAELFDDPAGKVKCLEMRVAAAKELEEQLRGQHAAGRVSGTALTEATLARLDAGIDLLKFKESAAPKPPGR